MGVADPGATLDLDAARGIVTAVTLGAALWMLMLELASMVTLWS